MEDSKLNLDARLPRCRRSSLVRRLVQARDDPAKRRIRHWLSDINDEQLLAFGLTEEDIALLRARPEGPHARRARTSSFGPCQPAEGVRHQQLVVEAIAEAQLLLTGYMQPEGHDSETMVEKLIGVLNRDQILNAVRRIKSRCDKTAA